MPLSNKLQLLVGSFLAAVFFVSIALPCCDFETIDSWIRAGVSLTVYIRSINELSGLCISQSQMSFTQTVRGAFCATRAYTFLVSLCSLLRVRID